MNSKIKISQYFIAALLACTLFFPKTAQAKDKVATKQKEIEETQKEFSWWPTDAKPSPVKDERGGYWWWPKEPGTASPLWGNRGYVYVYKIIFDYKADELPAPKPQEMRPSLIVKNIIKNVKIYFDYNKSEIRQDASEILKSAAKTLRQNPKADILVTGNCDTRGSETYNEKLGKRRADAVKNFLTEEGIDENHIRIVSQGKLNAIAPVTDLVGMQKDRNAQFMIAEVEEVMIPYEGGGDRETTEPVFQKNGQIVAEETTIESSVSVSTKEYTIKKNDTLWMIAQRELGSGHRWKYLYSLNKDKIKDPNRLRVGTKIVIPIE